MSFTYKIGSSFTCIILLMVFITAANWIGIKNSIRRHEEIIYFHSTLKNDMQKLIRNELSFSINKRPVHSQIVFSTLESIKRNLQSELNGNRETLPLEMIQKIMLDLDQYEKLFLEYTRDSIQKQTLESRLFRESKRMLSVSETLFSAKAELANSIILNIAEILQSSLRYTITGESFKANSFTIYNNIENISQLCLQLRNFPNSDTSLKLRAYRLTRIADVYKQTYQKFVISNQQLYEDSQLLQNQLNTLELRTDQYIQFQIERVNEKSTYLQNIIITITTIAILLSILATILLTHLIVTPINRLKASAQHIVEGNFETSVPILSNDEIGQLGYIFNQMTQKLRQSFTNLEEYKNHLEIIVDERTQELQMKITQHQNTQRALIASQKNMQRIVDQIPVGIILFDKDFRVVQWNPACNAIFGYTQEESTGKHTRFLVPPSSHQLIEDIFSTLYNSKDAVKSTNNNLTKDGRTILCDWYNAPFLDYEDRISGILSIVEDVTVKRRTEKELLKIAKLEAAGILAGGIAHDFNNILTAILGNINLAVQDAKIPTVTFNLLKSAEKASIRAKSLTQQLLTFAKGGDPVKETTSVKELIIESANFVLHGGNVSASFSIPDDLFVVDADKGQISQVVQNIILNSRHAMPGGGVISISCMNTLKSRYNYSNSKQMAGQYVEIAISDQGIGISEEMIDRIFDPYFTTKQEGSGLGLSIVHSIIQRHNGHISVESQLGQGTTFFISLPASHHLSAHPSQPPDLTAVIAPATILIMDDEDIVLDILEQMLTKAGHAVITSKNGNECLSLYKQRKNTPVPFDVIIMDLTIPGGKGGKDTALDVLRFDPAAKIIVASGYSNDPIISNFRHYGFSNALSKPFTSEELYSALNTVLTQKP